MVRKGGRKGCGWGVFRKCVAAHGLHGEDWDVGAAVWRWRRVFKRQVNGV